MAIDIGGLSRLITVCHVIHRPPRETRAELRRKPRFQTHGDIAKGVSVKSYSL